MTKHILLLPGDGVGPEVMPEAVKVLEKVKARFGLSVTLDQDLAGGASIDANGVPLTDAVLEKAKAADAVLFGSVGGPSGTFSPSTTAPRSPS
jgi:3-isopropylmalate dehydrogenase